MPFRAGNGAKEMAMFSMFAKSRQKKYMDKKRRGSFTLDTTSTSIPVYVPGYVLFPMPGQPWWLFDIDVAFWGCALYVIGGVIYIAQSLYFWHDLKLTPYDDYNPNNPSNYLNLVASALFVANAVVCQMDWYFTKSQTSIMNLNLEHLEDEHSEKKGVFHVDEISNRIMTLYFWNNNFFFAAAMVFLIWGTWQYESTMDTLGCRETLCWSFIMPFCATTFYCLSALCALWEYFENANFRRKSGLPALTLFNWDFYQVDWFGWGDLLYIIAAILPWFQAFLGGFGNEEQKENSTLAPLYFTSNLVFLIDALCYQIGYQLFINEIITVMKKRHDEEVDEHKREGGLHHIHDDHSETGDDGDGSGKPSQYIKHMVTKMVLRRENTMPKDRRRRNSGHGASVMTMHRQSYGGSERGSFSQQNLQNDSPSPRRLSRGVDSPEQFNPMSQGPPPGFVVPSPRRESFGKPLELSQGPPPPLRAMSPASMQRYR